MKFGYFDDDNREYVIERPDTPLPWINYLGNSSFFGMISNTAGGYCFMIDARKQRMTRYRYNNVPMDAGGRYFYVREPDRDRFWSPSWMPVKAELDFYQCRHGLGYSVITGERDGLRLSTRYFVPPEHPLEIWETDIHNRSNNVRKIQLFSFVEFCLWEALNDNINLQRTLNLGEVEVDGGVIYHKTEYRERRSHFAYFAASEPVAGTDTDRDAFLGPYNGFHEPEAVRRGKPGDSVASGWNPVGSHCIEITLQPDEVRSINFALGYFANPEKHKFEAPDRIDKKGVNRVLRLYLDRKGSEKAFVSLRNSWEGLLAHLQVDSPDAELNTMVNTWHQYQCMMTYNMARSASYYETGIGRGIGFRDACQDIFGAVHMLPPARSRERILDLAAIQWRNGACYHQYQLLDKKGNADMGVGFNDDPPWLILAAAAYLKETGDWSILDEMTPFDNNPQDSATLYEHLKVSFRFTLDHLGPHKLPLIGRADWNDCLNLTVTSIKPGDTFQADALHAGLDEPIGRVPESLMIAAQFVWAGKEFIRIADFRDDPESANLAREGVAQMIEAINRAGWDGEWFLRAYDRDGRKIGSAENEEGRIFIEPQALMGVAGVGLEDGRLQKALDSLAGHLFTEHGIILQQPAYTAYDQKLGEITSYPPGVKENAGIFCHPNGWVIMAECNLGRGDKAMDYYKAICPAHRESISEVHRCEPYCYCQMIAGPDSPRHGEGKNSWLTGTASANFLAVSQYILGIRPEYDGLLVDPCIPASWRSFTARRRYRGANYNIRVDNSAGVTKGVVKITVDGQPLNAPLLPVFADNEDHEVHIVMG